MPRDPVWPNNDNFQCVRTLDHKYLFRVPDKQSEFYDLSRDPLEQSNLLESGVAYDAELLAELRTQLIEALRDLGYVGGAEDGAPPP